MNSKILFDLISDVLLIINETFSVFLLPIIFVARD